MWFFFLNDTPTTEIYTDDTLFPDATLFRSRRTVRLRIAVAGAGLCLWRDHGGERGRGHSSAAGDGGRALCLRRDGRGSIAHLFLQAAATGRRAPDLLPRSKRRQARRHPARGRGGQPPIGREHF